MSNYYKALLFTQWVALHKSESWQLGELGRQGTKDYTSPLSED